MKGLKEKLLSYLCFFSVFSNYAYYLLDKNCSYIKHTLPISSHTIRDSLKEFHKEK